MLSFVCSENDSTILITDADRVIQKVRTYPESDLKEIPKVLVNAIQTFALVRNFSFNEEISAQVLYSEGSGGSRVVFKNPDLSAPFIASNLEKYFGIEAQASNEKITIGNVSYEVKFFGDFCCVSDQEVVPCLQTAQPQVVANTDYIVFGDETVVHHVLSGSRNFSLWQAEKLPFAGSPQKHRALFEKMPAEFSEIIFWGSSRLQTDADYFSGAQFPDGFSWMDNGFAVLKKDTFCLILAAQNEQRDLRLILEEETIRMRPDSIIHTFRVGDFEIMPFEMEQNWNKRIDVVSDEMRFFTAFDNINVLANSIPAMRWYLTEIQSGNFFVKDEFLENGWSRLLPERASELRLTRSNGDIRFHSVTAGQNGKEEELITEIVLKEKMSESEAQVNEFSFTVAIVPTEIQIVRVPGGTAYLLSNKRQLALYDKTGNQKWMINLNSDLIQSPLLIDLENDGATEFLLFLANQMLVVSSAGKVVPGFPFSFQDVSSGGTAVNYDNKFEYRFFVSSGKKMICVDESGKKVEGWSFGGMESELKGPVMYAQPGGLDFICFRDNSKNHFRLNRRGENRYTKKVSASLVYPAPFLVGTSENNLRMVGFNGQYIQQLYLKDGNRDSIKLDESVQVKNQRWILRDKQMFLVLEEAHRVLTVDEFGFTVDQILKSDSEQRLVFVSNDREMIHVFTDNSQNNLYLRDKGGKMIFSHPVKGSAVLNISHNQLVSLCGNKVFVYPLN